jgi:hypothetical protein
MPVPIRFFPALRAVILFAGFLFCGSAALFGQNSGVNLALHANSHARAADIGMPPYPGATLYKDKDNDS